jgi:hypothetical protein
VEESVAAPEVLAGVALAGAGALVCGALVAGASCAIAGTPRLAASKIAAMDPGVTVLLFTLSLLSAQKLGTEEAAHTPRFRTCPLLMQVAGQTGCGGDKYLYPVHFKSFVADILNHCGYCLGYIQR